MRRHYVSRAEFVAFAATYPNPLDRDVTGICDPPLMTMNDFTDGKVWPESIVCGASLGESWGGVDEYFVMLEEEKQ